MKPLDFEVDIDRYMGEWYEQARKPQRHQVGCVETKAIYTFDKEKKQVLVHNQCTSKTGETREAKAFALPGNAKNNVLKVYFTKWFAGNYWLLDLDPDYQWAVVGEPCKKFAWVLSRQQTVNSEEVVKRLNLLRSKGYNISDIILKGESDQSKV